MKKKRVKDHGHAIAGPKTAVEKCQENPDTYIESPHPQGIVGWDI
jgi:hypothetical protein